MTYQGKQILTLRPFGPIMIAILAIVIAGTALAATTRLGRFVTDPLTGVAINGYDPVSYFTGEAPAPGLSDHEYYWKGVPWYFANAANRDVFRRAPEVYAPQFGGYGTMSVSRGFLSDADPTIYAVMDNELFLFYSAGNREAFLAADKTARLRAREKWRILAETRFGQ